MNKAMFEHPFEPENRYNLDLKINMFESRQAFSASLRVGYGLPIPLNPMQRSFYYTHHRSPKKKFAALAELEDYLDRAEAAIKAELKENFFILDTCYIQVTYENQPPIIIRKFGIRPSHALAIFEGEKAKLLDAIKSQIKPDCCPLY